MKIRKDQKSNYMGIWNNGKTLRVPINPNIKITELNYPEFYDVSLGTFCKGGCKYCYASASTKGNNYSNVCEKIKMFFSLMPKEMLPFQVAIGGGGEPTLHPEFIDVLKTFHDLDIVPNYTTNGMHLSGDIIKASKEYCGGVALTLHNHLKRYWTKALDTLHDKEIKTNIHIIISDKNSIDYASEVYDKYIGLTEYFVLLPYMNYGFARNNEMSIDYPYLKLWMDKVYKNANISFGANFYEFLKQENKYGVSLYEPEIMSKYLVLSDPIKLYNNSFDCKSVHREWFNNYVENCEKDSILI